MDARSSRKLSHYSRKKITRAIGELVRQGYPVDQADLSYLSPYVTRHTIHTDLRPGPIEPALTLARKGPGQAVQTDVALCGGRKRMKKKTVKTTYGEVNAKVLEQLQHRFDTRRLLEVVDMIDRLRARICEADGLRQDEELPELGSRCSTAAGWARIACAQGGTGSSSGPALA